MGQEVKTSLRFDGRVMEGVALLEADSIAFRGPVELTVAFSEIHGIDTSPGWLELRTARGLLLFELGAKATVWAEKIRNPRGLIEKLGLEAGKKVAIVGKLDPDLRGDVEASGAKVAKSARGKDFDAIFVAAHAKKDLERLPALREMLREDGAIWIAFAPSSEELRERDVLIAGRSLQMTDSKPLKVSDALSAVRFIIPVAQRKKK